MSDNRKFNNLAPTQQLRGMTDEQVGQQIDSAKRVLGFSESMQSHGVFLLFDDGHGGACS